MTPQTEALALGTDTPFIFRVEAYNANTLILLCTGAVSPFTTLKAELHGTTDVGQTPFAEVIYGGAPGAGPHSFTFTAAQMNQLPAGVKSRKFILVILAQSGSGASIVKSVLAYVDFTLLASPCGNTAPPPPAPSTYATGEALVLLTGRVSALENGGGGGFGVRFEQITIAAGQSAAVLALPAGESIGGAPCPQRSGEGVYFQGVDYIGLNAVLQFSAPVVDDLIITVPITIL